MFVLWSSFAAAEVLRHALIVGANQGGGNLDPLRYAELDAERVSTVLVELGNFDPAHVTVLYGPTAAELKAALHAHRRGAPPPPSPPRSRARSPCSACRIAPPWPRWRRSSTAP